MILTIQQEIKRAMDLINGPTIENLFDVLPDSIVVNGETYIPCIMPSKGGVTFGSYICDTDNDKELIHTESVNGVKGVLIKLIKALSEKQEDNWKSI